MQLEKLLPEQIDGWVASGKNEVYDRKTIFQYMDGAGEIYLAYDFQRMLVREYKKESAPSIVAEIYQMSTSEDAYGIFSYDTDGEQVDLNQDGIYAMGLLRFWKDSIFARLIAERETDAARAVVMALGRKIADNIPDKGKKPALIDALPSEGLLKNDIHYFHKQILLNSLYYLADVNLLNLSEKTEVILARYHTGDHKVRLLLVRYQNPGEARGAYEQFSRIYLSNKPTKDSSIMIVKVEKGEFISTRLADGFVVLIFEAKNQETCERLTKAVVKRLRKVFPWIRGKE